MSFPGAPPFGYRGPSRGGYGPPRGYERNNPHHRPPPPHHQQSPQRPPPRQQHQPQNNAGPPPNGNSNGQNIFGVFVGDLPPEADETDLELLFSQIGPVVKCKVIRDAETSRSKRYGFVHYANDDLRQRAIAEIHGQAIKGQTINVRTQHYKETDRCLVKPGTKPTDIYIGNIPRGLTKFQIREEVGKWGIPQVKDVRSFKNDSGAYCFITFETEAEVTTTMSLLKDEFQPRSLAGRSLLIQGSNGSITSALNQNILRNSFAGNAEQQQQQQNLENLRQLLGGGTCPLDNRQLGLLEKSQRTLYIRNIPPKSTESALNEKFSKYGVLKKVIIVPATKEKQGYAFVEFMNASDCAQAALQDDCQLHDMEITIQVSRPPKEVHQIISTRGFTDSNGNLLPQFTPQSTSTISMLMNPTSYFQDPNTGQLFMGETQHAAHYIASGYIQVQPGAMYSDPTQQQAQPQQQQQQQQPAAAGNYRYNTTETQNQHKYDHTGQNLQHYVYEAPPPPPRTTPIANTWNEFKKNNQQPQHQNPSPYPPQHQNPNPPPNPGAPGGVANNPPPQAHPERPDGERDQGNDGGQSAPRGPPPPYQKHGESPGKHGPPPPQNNNFPPPPVGRQGPPRGPPPPNYHHDRPPAHGHGPPPPHPDRRRFSPY